jgi:uncharacterized protein (UPF0248 family)
LLWDNREQPVAALASILGRGLRGVEKRLAKLKDVESSAYHRLFVSSQFHDSFEEKLSERLDAKKLLPVSEVIRRVKYDDSIPSDRFSVRYYDRVEDAVLESPLMAPNTSIKGPKTLMVEALPEHRIVSVKYMDRVVWDKEARLDLVFSGPGIAKVIDSYEEWKRDRDAEVEWNRQRQQKVVLRLEQALGHERFMLLKSFSSSLQAAKQDPTLSTKMEAERFVKSCLDLFHAVQKNPSLSLDPTLIPRSDYEAMDLISELVALNPDPLFRQVVLSELSLCMHRCQGMATNYEEVDIARKLPTVREEDIIETFIRGSGKQNSNALWPCPFTPDTAS